MPRFLLPKYSTPHRVAAIALYRALLTRCTSAPLAGEDRASLRNVVRQKFRKNAKLQGPWQLGLTFKLGYETLDKLDAATAGDTSSASFLTSFLRSLPAGLKRPPRKRPLPPAPEVVEKHELACLPPEKAVLNVRPYANINGPRHVPVLASANGIPFLRFGKPQPPALSRILRQKLDKRITRFDTRVVMEHYWIPIAHQEDEWDDLLRQNYGVTDEGNGNADEGREVRWADAWYEAKHENVKAYEDDLYSDRRIAKQMQNLVDQETALALEEGQETGRLRNRRKPVKHRWAETRPS